MTSWADMVEEEEAQLKASRKETEEEWIVYQPKKKCIDCGKLINKRYNKCYDCAYKCKDHKLKDCWRCSVSKNQKKSRTYINNDKPRRKWRQKTVRGKLSKGVPHRSQQSKTQDTVQRNDTKQSSTKDIVDQSTKKS